jgi:hypothetical protein
MGYKTLGFLVWQGGKWYLRRRGGGTKRKMAIAGLGVAVVGGVLAVSQRQPSSA